MTCEVTRKQLTAYLDGELEGDRGSAIRGHLRSCDACRGLAADEAALRDGLRALPPLEPPSTLWAGVQRQLAAAEVADAERPGWRRALSRWLPSAPRLGVAGLALAAATGLVVWRATHHRAEPPPAQPVVAHHEPVKATPPPPASSSCTMDDVTAELAAAPGCLTQSYADSAADLAKDAAQVRAQWTVERQQTFDARVSELRAKIAAAAPGRAQQDAYRALVRYYERAVTLDEVALR